MCACIIFAIIVIFFLVRIVTIILRRNHQGFAPLHKINDMGIRVPKHSVESARVPIQHKLVVPKSYTDDSRHLIEFNF